MNKAVMEKHHLEMEFCIFAYLWIAMPIWVHDG